MSSTSLYMGSALHGDFGISFQSPTETVIQLIGRTWPISIQLGGLAILVAFSSGLTFGIIAAVKQNTWIDYVVTFISTLGITVPNFVIAIWLLLMFAVQLRWLPTGGWPSGGTDWNTMILPVITLALGPTAAGGALHPLQPGRSHPLRLYPHRPRQRLAGTWSCCATRSRTR